MPNNHQKILKNHVIRLITNGLLLSCFPAAESVADELDTLQFNASVNHAWDNNLFRVKNNESSDQITTSTAGVRFDKQYSMQRFTFDVNYIDYKYKNSDFLDFDTVNYNANWRWTLTPSLSGTLSSSRSKSLLGFGDFRALTQNIRTDEYNAFRAEYSPHQIWALIAGVTSVTLKNSQVFTAQNDYESTAFDYGARYNFPSGTNLTLLGHRRSGDYKRVLNSVDQLDNAYNEDEFELDVLFKATAKSNLSGKVAYLSREYDNFSRRDYGAWLGYLHYDLLLTSKLKTSLDISRSVASFETLYSTYSATDAISWNANYFFTEKLIFTLNARFAERDFKKGINPLLPSRVDDERSIGGSIVWQPIKNLGLTLNSIKSSRKTDAFYSNAFDYDDVTTSVTIDLKI